MSDVEHLHVESPQDAIVSLGLRAVLNAQAVFHVTPMHAILIGEFAVPGEEGGPTQAIAFGASTGPLIESNDDMVAYLDYHLSKALEALGRDWREYRLAGTERPKRT